MAIDRQKLPAGFVADPDRPTKVTVTIVDDDLYGQNGCDIQLPRLSVKGDRGVEWSGGGLIDFTVSVDRESIERFTVQYRTEDVTGPWRGRTTHRFRHAELRAGGRAGQDDRGAQDGAPQSRTVRVHILDDDVEDSGETFRLCSTTRRGRSSSRRGDRHHPERGGLRRGACS